MKKYIRLKPPIGGVYTADYMKGVFVGAVGEQAAGNIDWDAWAQQAADASDDEGRPSRNVAMVLDWESGGGWWLACNEWTVRMHTLQL